MRLLGKQTVFSRGEGIVFGMVSILLCVSVLLSVRFAISRAEHDFMQRAASVYEELTQRLGSLEAVLVALAGLHHASDDLSQAQFSTFAQELLGAYPYIGSIPFLTKTSSEDLDVFRQSMRDRGFAALEVTERDTTGQLIPVAPRPFYLPVSSIDPLEALSARFLGYDAASDPLLASSLQQAVTSGAVVASLPTASLWQEQSMVLFKAVYQGRYAPQTIESRRALLHGIVALALPHHFVTDLVQAYPAFKVSLVRQHFREDDLLGSAYRRGSQPPACLSHSRGLISRTDAHSTFTASRLSCRSPPPWIRQCYRVGRSPWHWCCRSVSSRSLSQRCGTAGWRIWSGTERNR